MKFLDVVAVILAIVSVLLVSSGVASVGLTIGLEKAGQALPAAAEPVVSGSGAEVQRSVVEDRDRDAALVLLLFGISEGRRGP